MKKFLSLFLCLALVFGLAACGGNTVPETPEDDSAFKFEDVKKGRIMVINEEQDEIIEDEEFECTDDFFLYLPAGTKLWSEKSFSVLCYREGLVLDEALMEGCGQKLMNKNPFLSAEEKTIPEDCYVRIVVKGELKEIKISAPEGKENLVMSGTRSEIKYADVLKTVRQGNFGNEAVNYIFISDLHYYSPAATPKQIEYLDAVVTLANSDERIDFICLGGDYTNGLYKTKFECLDYMKELFEPLKKSEKPVFILTGNHDDNSYHVEAAKKIDFDVMLSDKDWSDNVIAPFCAEVVKDSKYPESKYFYYDLKDKKTRVICLDAIDCRAEFNESGRITKLRTEGRADGWSGYFWWGYSEEQINWLVTEAMTAEDDWNYVFLSHMGIIDANAAGSYKAKYGSELAAVIQAYQDKKTFKADTVDAEKDFSATTGRILVYHHGHEHKEGTVYMDNLGLWKIMSPNANGDALRFDVVSATDNAVYKFPVGFGAEQILENK